MVLEILKMFFNFIKSRVFIAFILIAAMFSILIYRVFEIQIVNADEYIERYSQKTEKTRYYNTTRGNIYDTNGKLLAYNVSVYSVVIEDTLDSSIYKSDQMNQIINTTVNIIEKNGDSVDTDFPIEYVDGNIIWSQSISENSRLRFLKDIYGTETLDTEEKKLSETTAEEAFAYLTGEEKYDVDMELYSKREAFYIIMIRYNLSLNAYQKYISTTIATDVSENTTAAIYESADIIPGVNISQTTKRIYNDSFYFAHIIGYTGKISDEQMTELNGKITDEDNKYALNDIVGKTGVEASMELTLSGNKGYDRVIVDTTGKVLSVIDEKKGVAGNDVYLTIDSDLQKGIYHLIEEMLAGILIEKIVNRNLTESDKTNWLIPIKDVYFQIINNNIADIEKFNLEGASENERSIYGVLSAKKETVLSGIRSELYNNQAAALGSLSEEYNEYYTFIFNMLSDSSYNVNLIPKSRIDTNDSKYKEWMRDSLSLREILLYSIDQNWVDTSKLNVSSSYIDRESIYNSLVEYIMNYIGENKAFEKLLYKYLIELGTISGGQICRLLYDQGVLEYDAATYSSLASGTMSPYNFIISKIQSLELTPAMIALKPCSATITVVESGTSNVLAMVSYPSYDNNAFSGSIDYDTWTALSEDLSSPLFDRATKMRTAPGSTFKPLSAIAGLETGVISPSSYITCNGIFNTIEPPPKCWIYPSRHGALDVVGGIKNSCNVFFYEVGYRLSTMNGSYDEQEGLSHLKKYGQMVGLTETSGVEIEEYSPLFSTINPVPSSIGQGSHSFTSVQLARYVNTIASNGTNYELTLIKDIKNINGESEALPEKNVTPIEVSPVTIGLVQKGMLEAARTYGGIRNLSYPVGGKTGTAQESANSPDHALMIAFAPYDNPEVSVSVMLQNGYSSSYASQLMGDVLEYYFGNVTLEQILNGNADGPAPLTAEPNAN